LHQSAFGQESQMRGHAFFFSDIFGNLWIGVVDVSTSCAETIDFALKSILLQMKQAFMPRPNGIPWRGSFLKQPSVLSRSPKSPLQ
jgi:hypothetical protein